MLEHYVKAKSWNIVDVYVDDGYTGLNTKRPSFQRLIKDVEDRKIDIVITKDHLRQGKKVASQDLSNALIVVKP